jgi:hypothetical protein
MASRESKNSVLACCSVVTKTCIRFPLSIGFVDRTCDVQRALTWSLICENGDKDTPNAALVSKIDTLIKKIVQYGQAASGNTFRLYVTGYAQFFNDATTACDIVTFARTANPNDDGKNHPLMTTELRQDFNLMSLTLNLAIQTAVGLNSASNVKYIDIDSLMGTGHRFCEPGIVEPDQTNSNLWFWHYPYNIDKTEDPTVDYLNSVVQANVNALTWNSNTTLWTDYVTNFWSYVNEDQLLLSANATSDNATADYDVWPDEIGSRAKSVSPTTDVPACDLYSNCAAVPPRHWCKQQFSNKLNSSPRPNFHSHADTHTHTNANANANPTTTSLCSWYILFPPRRVGGL